MNCWRPCLSSVSSRQALGSPYVLWTPGQFSSGICFLTLLGQAGTSAPGYGSVMRVPRGS